MKCWHPIEGRVSPSFVFEILSFSKYYSNARRGDSCTVGMKLRDGTDAAIEQKGEYMPDLHFTTLIEGSAETVFALIADLAHYDRWLPGSKAFGTITQISPLPVGLGTTYIDAGPTGTRHGEVTEYDPPTRISFHQPMQVKQRLLTGTIDIHLRHTLEPTEQMTRLNRDLTLHIHGLLKVAQPFVIAAFRQENERMLLALKRYVEQGT
jgi:uncharacterized protein YndB with AHSA1/START domain